MKFKQFFLIIVLGIFYQTIFAQNFKKVVGRPIVFSQPLANIDGASVSTKEKENSIPWVVICDRSSDDNTRTYNSPNGEVRENIQFKDWFYVLEEEGVWIRIGKAKISSGTKISGDVRDYGWIEKKNMLLWTSGLLDASTRIHKKAFLLNKKKEIIKILTQRKKEIVEIFKGPDTGEKIGEKTIYEFYFVLKEEGNKVLLSKEARLSPNSTTDWEGDLVGWVRGARATQWNTRICLEPNFKQSAFEERRDNPDFRLRAYPGVEYANNHATDKKISNVEWDNDPVIIDASRLAKDDPRRFGGGVVRFPMFSSSLHSFETGVIGEIKVGTLGKELEAINEIDYSGILNKVKNSESSRDNYNVFFLVEGTEAMKGFQSAIIDAVKALQPELSNIPNVRYGAAVYRDSYEKDAEKIFQIQPLSPNADAAINFLQNASFRKWYDNENYTVMHYGLDKTLQEAGFNTNHTNIVFVIGSYGDYSRNILRQREADKNQDPTNRKDISSIVDNLSKLNVHLTAIQCRRDDGAKSQSFTDQSQNLILESAKAQYNLYKGATDYIDGLTLMTASNIVLDYDDEERIHTLKGGATKGFVVQPSEGGTISPQDLTKQLISCGKSIQTYTNNFWNEMNRVLEDGAPIDNISAGALAPAAAQEIIQLVKQSQGSGGWNKEDIKKLAREKYKLYTEVYIPKHINGADYPTHSFVLFMPQEDLEEYMIQIEKIEYAINGATPEELREVIYNMFLNLLFYYTGNDNERNNSRMSTADLRRIMQGLEKEGMESLERSTDFKIEDIMGNRAMDDEAVRNFTDQILSNSKKLSRILAKGKNYEFSYTSGGNTYYWVPIDWTF